MESLQGVVEQLTYHSEESGYTVARLKAPRTSELVTITGNFATIQATQKAIKEVMLFLQSHGVSTTYAVKIYKQYGDESIATVTHNPYQLATDVYGIGFVTADARCSADTARGARNLGIAPSSQFRYRAGILMLSRNLIYTGLTRAKKLAIVVGPQKAIALAVRQVKDRQRYTLLDQRLREQ